jgi:predicted nucleotidyltransferase
LNRPRFSTRSSRRSGLRHGCRNGRRSSSRNGPRACACSRSRDSDRYGRCNDPRSDSCPEATSSARSGTHPAVRLTSLAAVDILSLEERTVKSHCEIERTLRRNLPELRRRFKVRRIGVFGSVVRGEQHGRSDLDILVEYSETPSLLAVVALKRHLTELTGERVDLVPASALKPAYRRAILDEVVYA